MKNTITPEEHARIKRRRWRQTLGLLITVLVLTGALAAKVFIDELMAHMQQLL